MIVPKRIVFLCFLSTKVELNGFDTKEDTTVRYDTIEVETRLKSLQYLAQTAGIASYCVYLPPYTPTTKARCKAMYLRQPNSSKTTFVHERESKTLA